MRDHAARRRDDAPARVAKGLAIGVALVALRWLLDPILGYRHAFLAQNVATALVTFVYGAGPGWATLVVTTVLSLILFALPHLDPAEGTIAPLVSVVLSVAASAFVIVIIDALRRSRREAQALADSAVEARELARQRDTYLREFIDHTSAVVYVRDLTGRTLLANERHDSVFAAAPPDGGDGARARELAETRASLDRSVAETGESHTYEEVVPMSDGPHTWVSVKFPIADDAGRTIAIGGVSTDVTELHNARADLERKEQILRRLIEVQEQEKQLLCGEFHDGLIQYAVGAKMLLESLDRDGMGREAVASLDEAIDSLSRGIEDGRRVIHGIRPAELDDLGLAAALQSLVDDMAAAGIAVAAAVDPMLNRLPQSFQVTIYRIVQEALSNVRRHSGSRTARLRVGWNGDAIAIVVADDGCGFDGRLSGPRGFGLTGMAERARLFGGECTVEGRPGKGTTVSARLPIPDSPAEDASGEAVSGS